MRIAIDTPCLPASQLLRKSISQPRRRPERAAESDLLKTVRGLVNGPISGVDAVEHRMSLTADGAEEELAWSRTKVAVSVGSSVVRQWDFEDEEQEVQFACWAFVDHVAHTDASSGNMSDVANAVTGADSVPALDPRTFGPFARNAYDTRRSSQSSVAVRALFVFFRTLGRIFLDNGIEYTFHIPFITKRAWPMYPRGVIIERMPTARRPDAPLLFALTDPLAEVIPVGMADSLSRGPMSHRDLSDTLSPSERVAAVIVRSEPLPCPIIVTIHGRSRLSLWRVECNRRTVAPLAEDRGQHFRAPGSAENLHPDAGEQTLLTRSLLSSASMAAMDGSQNDSQSQSQPWTVMSPRADLSLAMDRMALASRAERDVLQLSPAQVDVEGGVLLARLASFELMADCDWSESGATAFVFDAQKHQWGFVLRVGVHFPTAKSLVTIELKQYFDGRIFFSEPLQLPALSAIPIRGVRPSQTDVLVLKPSNEIVCLAFGLREIKLSFPVELLTAYDGDIRARDQAGPSALNSGNTVPTDIIDPAGPSFTVVFGATQRRVKILTEPRDALTRDCFSVLAYALPQAAAYSLYCEFIANIVGGTDDEFKALSLALLAAFVGRPTPAPGHALQSSWEALLANTEFRDDPAFAFMSQPPLHRLPNDQSTSNDARSPHLPPILFALHLLGQDYKLSIQKTRDLHRLAPLIIGLARKVRPIWADHWTRVCPDTGEAWLDAASSGQFPVFQGASNVPVLSSPAGITDALPQCAPDLFRHLRCRLLRERCSPWPTLAQVPVLFSFEASLECGSARNPLQRTQDVLTLFSLLTDDDVPSVDTRSESIIRAMVSFGWTRDHIETLPTGISMPLREALRRCQHSPPGNWPAVAYDLIGRQDLAQLTVKHPSSSVAGSSPWKRRRVRQILDDMHANISTDARQSSGVDLNNGGFTDVRFNRDRRLQEVARILQSSSVPTVMMSNVAEISEHDLAREHQHLVLRVCERTLALPLGRALFTFGTLTTLLRDAYVVPKLEFDVRIFPQNILVTAEAGKLTVESRGWAEFHNGVAAALRISPGASSIDSAWIASNKPTDLTPQHAGFLFGLGLTGHLKSMVTWHTFSYLTPKHDLTSAGILLGLAAGNVGTGNRNVTKLIAVHTPALLPNPGVDLNIPLVIQAAGLSGLGLLYLGTRNRHMAEVTITEIGRRQAVQYEPIQENREAYALSAAIAFGMVMIGTRSSSLSPADMHFVQQLRRYIHGTPPSTAKSSRPDFDVNVTSPVATIALALMFLKSERQDIADIVALPATAHALDYVPPNLLLLRTLAKAMIMWEGIAGTREWVHSQVPSQMLQAIGRPYMNANESLELAYYHVVAGACFAIGLKFAGSGRIDARETLIGYFDHFTKCAAEAAGKFEQKIKRAAVLDGINVIAVSMGLVMAGSGDIACLRRLRTLHGQTSAPYGVHVAAHMAIGLLFLGGGRYTLCTSDAAVACLVASFFPRFPRGSGDSVAYVQALRHLWVLASEPRCIVACDVDTGELVSLPLKIMVSHPDKVGAAEIVSPALIPEMDKVQEILVDSPRHWPLRIDLASVAQHRAALLRTQTIFVKKKTGFLSYDGDYNVGRGGRDGNSCQTPSRSD